MALAIPFLFSRVWVCKCVKSFYSIPGMQGGR